MVRARSLAIAGVMLASLVLGQLVLSQATVHAQTGQCSNSSASTSVSCSSPQSCATGSATVTSPGCTSISSCTTIVGTGTPVFVSCGAAAASIHVDTGGPYAGQAGQPITMIGGGGIAGATPVSYHWNFGDNQVGIGAVVSHTYLAPGAYTVALTVGFSDGSLGSAETVAQVGLPLPSRQISLSNGCNNVSLTSADSTLVSSIVASISGGSIVSVWKLGAGGTYLGWFPGNGAPSDLTTVNRLDAVFICIQGSGALTQPGA